MSVLTRRVIIFAAPESRGESISKGVCDGKELQRSRGGRHGDCRGSFLDILAKRPFPLRSLKLIASPRSAGKKITFGEQDIEVEALSEASFEGCDLAFISATDEISRDYAPMPPRPAPSSSTTPASGAWTGRAAGVPEINPDDVMHHKGILAIPNCSTTPLVMTLWPLHKLNP